MIVQGGRCTTTTSDSGVVRISGRREAYATIPSGLCGDERGDRSQFRRAGRGGVGESYNDMIKRKGGA